MSNLHKSKMLDIVDILINTSVHLDDIPTIDYPGL